VDPWFVTADEISDLQALEIHTELIGATMQRASTSQMLSPVRILIAYLSQDTTLLPGTLILTGSPAGVGFARMPPLFLCTGDVIAVTIAGVGRLESRIDDAQRGLVWRGAHRHAYYGGACSPARGRGGRSLSAEPSPIDSRFTRTRRFLHRVARCSV